MKFKSSNIDEGEFFPERGEIELTFQNGTRYCYSGCTEHHWDGLRMAKSAGKFFHSHIKKKKWRRIEPEGE